MYRYKKVLVPLDGSKMAEVSLKHLERLAKAGHIDDVIILKVIPILPTASHSSVLAEEREFSEKYLADIKSKLSSKALNVKTMILEGSIALSIADYAKKISADLIIISVNGHGGLQRVMIGSVAYKLINDPEIHAPILLVRPQVS